MESQRVGHDWVTEQKQQELKPQISLLLDKDGFLPPSTEKAPFTGKIYFLISGRQRGEVWLTTKFCSADNAGTKNAFKSKILHVEAIDIVIKKT